MNIDYDDRRAHVAVKIERAEKHIQDLTEIIKKFSESNPYSVMGTTESEAFVYRIKIHKHPPRGWSAVIGDAIHNMRAAMDVLVWQLILANGKDPTRASYFPVAKSAGDCRNNLKTKTKGVSPKALELLMATEPFVGGKGNDLWLINELDIRDKHRLLVPVFTQLPAISINQHFADSLEEADMPESFKESARAAADLLPTVFLNPAYKGPIHDGDIVFQEPKKPTTTPKFSFNMAFGEGELVEGEPILPTLRRFLQTVKETLEPFSEALAPPDTPYRRMTRP